MIPTETKRPRWLIEGANRFGARRFFAQERRIHVTELLKPANMVRLTDRHWPQIEIPPEDLIPAMIGVAWHEWIEGLDDEGESERTHTAPIKIYIDPIYGAETYTITGTPDWYSARHATLRDYKTAKMWAHVFGRREWEEQLNVYRWLLWESAHITIAHMELHVVYLDWTANQAKRNPDLPPSRLMVYDVPVWPMADAEEFIRGRLADIADWPGTGTLDGVCSPEERWQRDEHWAVMKDGRKTALKRCASEDEAAAYIEESDKNAGLYIEHRPGTPVRCLDWCAVRKWCAFGKTLEAES